MVNVKLINDKITDRAVKMLIGRSGIKDYEEAKKILLKNGSVKKALDYLKVKQFWSGIKSRSYNEI